VQNTPHTHAAAPRFAPPKHLSEAPEPFIYDPRSAPATVHHRIVRDHLLTFLEQTAERRGAPLPRFVERDLRGFVDCGVLAKGFARLRCHDSDNERLVPFSCKGRGFCSSSADDAWSSAQHTSSTASSHTSPSDNGCSASSIH
jgi:hypothetical protein